MQTGSNHKDRIPTLDALRGLAALAVMWCHFTEEMAPHTGTGIVYQSGTWAWHTLEMFFVISGFGMPYAMHRAGYTLSGYGKFLLKRIARLDPPYLISILLIIGYQYAVTLRPGYQGEDFRLSLPQLLSHLGYLNAFCGYEWFNPVYWTLAIEFQYYLVIGLLFPLLFSRGERTRYVTLAVLLLLSFSPYVGETILLYLGAFSLGFLTLHHRLKMMTTKTYVTVLAVVTVSQVFATGAGAALFSAATALTIAFVRIDSRMLSFFGLISYSLYLLHWPLGQPLLAMFQSSTGRPYLTLFIAIAAVILAAYVYYWLVERPSQALSSRFRYRPHRKMAVGR
jgi:peptidoglycan/LPS O-acetylase OafA/YrhL